MFFKKNNLLIVKNFSNNKCLLFCYIRKYKNPILKNPSKITKVDLQIANEIINETNSYFENISISKLDKVEVLLNCNIHMFLVVTKILKIKKIIIKSSSEFDKDLDLLLIDNINHYILIKNLNKFISDNSHVVETCRVCLNSFYSKHKYKEHIEYCKNRKPKRLMSPYKNISNFQISKIVF